MALGTSAYEFRFSDFPGTLDLLAFFLGSSMVVEAHKRTCRSAVHCGTALVPTIHKKMGKLFGAHYKKKRVT